MADVGYITLVLALVASLYSAIAFIFGAKRQNQALMNSARITVLAAFTLVSAAVVTLAIALVTHDFSIEYVASYSSRDMSLPYLLSALWAGNDGSLLFWGWLLSIFATIVVIRKRNIRKPLIPYASSIIMVTQGFFLILLLSVSNPFEKLSFSPSDGMGLNPLLENPGMIVHPPALLAGYAGFTVPFAFAISALLAKRLNDEWITAIRRWTLFTWLILGIGNLIGAWWAYVELGWGGYWAWDPVENAGLIPWLLATAFIHSLIMQRRRGTFKVWTLVLIILTFTMAIFGTFLTRSGILSSVHTFPDTGLGPFFLTFIGITLVGSLTLLLYRRKDLRGEVETESIFSREGTFLLNNILFVGSAVVIFLGTIFPLISEALGGTRITVGAVFFNQVNGPIFLAIIFLSGVCAIIAWRRASVRDLMRRLVLPLAASIVVGVILFTFNIRQWYTLGTFFLCSFVFFSIIFEWFRVTRTRHHAREESYQRAFFSLLRGNRSRYGGYIIHIAMVIIAIGVIGSSFYDVEAEATLSPGDSMTIRRYTLTYEGLESYQTESGIVVGATLTVMNGNKVIGQVVPEKYFHESYEQPVTEVAIRSTLAEDLYVILMGWDEQGIAAFSVLVNPVVIWIWIGGGFFLLGGLIAFWPEQRTMPATGQTSAKRKKAVSTPKGGRSLKKGSDVEDEIEKQVRALRKSKK